MSYLLEVKYVEKNRHTDYQYPIVQTTDNPMKFWHIRTRDALRKGDGVNPTPYYHGSVYCGATQTYYSGRYVWDWKSYSNIWRLFSTVINQPAGPEHWDNVFFNTNVQSYQSIAKPGDTAMSDLQALNRLKQRKVGLGQMVAEFTESANFIIRATLTLVNFLSAIKRKKYSKSLQILGITKDAFVKNAHLTASQKFLEWNFAVKPMICDISDVMSLVKKQLADLDLLYLTAKGCHVHSTGPLKTPDASGVGYSFGLTQTVRTKIYARIDDLELVVQKAVGLDSIYPSIYEIIPYSWMLDYVVNLGDVIEAATATRGLTFVSGYNSTRLQGQAQKYNLLYKTVDGNCADNLQYKNYVVDCYRRDVLGGFPLPRTSFVLPGLDLKQGLLVVAVLLQLTSGGNSLRN